MYRQTDLFNKNNDTIAIVIMMITRRTSLIDVNDMVVYYIQKVELNDKKR